MFVSAILINRSEAVNIAPEASYKTYAYHRGGTSGWLTNSFVALGLVSQSQLDGTLF
jgi:hypothetical protein